VVFLCLLRAQAFSPFIRGPLAFPFSANLGTWKEKPRAQHQTSATHSASVHDTARLQSLKHAGMQRSLRACACRNIDIFPIAFAVSPETVTSFPGGLRASHAVRDRHWNGDWDVAGERGQCFILGELMHQQGVHVCMHDFGLAHLV